MDSMYFNLFMTFNNQISEHVSVAFCSLHLPIISYKKKKIGLDCIFLEYVTIVHMYWNDCGN